MAIGARRAELSPAREANSSETSRMPESCAPGVRWPAARVPLPTRTNWLLGAAMLSTSSSNCGDDRNRIQLSTNRHDFSKLDARNRI